MLAVHFFGKTYGWTEQQTMHETSEAGFDWLPKIEQGEQKAAEIRRKQAERESRHSR